MACHIKPSEFKRGEFRTDKRKERGKAFDNPPYLLGNRRAYLYDRYLGYIPKSLVRNRELRNQFRNATAFIKSKYSHIDIFKRFGFYGNIQEYEFLRFYITKKLVNEYGAPESLLKTVYDNRYSKAVEGILKGNYVDVENIELTPAFWKNFSEKRTNIDNFISDYINYAKKEGFFKNDARELSHFASASAFAVYTAIAPAPSNYVYSLYDKVETDMKLERIYKNPLTWGTIFLNEYAYEKTIALENAIRSQAVDDITSGLKDIYQAKIKESMDISLLTFSKIASWAYEGVLSGSLVANIVGEVGSSTIATATLQAVGRTALLIASFIPAVRLGRIAYTVGEFLLKSFTANFAFQVYLEWELDGYIQELMRPLLDKLPYNVYKEEMRRIHLKEDYSDLYRALLAEKGIYQYIYNPKLLPPPKLSDVLARIRNRPYYNEETIARMLWHLNISALKLQAKIFLHKKKLEEERRRFRERLKGEIEAIKTTSSIDATLDIKTTIEAINRAVGNIPDFNLKITPDKLQVSSDGVNTNIYFEDGYDETLEFEPTDRRLLCEAGTYYSKNPVKVERITGLSLKKSSWRFSEDNYGDELDFEIIDYYQIVLSKWSREPFYWNVEINKRDYLDLDYGYSERFEYDEVFYRVLKSLMYENHFIRRIYLFSRYAVIYFDSGHKVYIYYSDKKAYCYFSNAEQEEYERNLYSKSVAERKKIEGYRYKDVGDQTYSYYYNCEEAVIYNEKKLNYYRFQEKSKYIIASFYSDGETFYLWIRRWITLPFIRLKSYKFDKKSLKDVGSTEDIKKEIWTKITQEIYLGFNLKTKSFIKTIDFTDFQFKDYIVHSYIETKNENGSIFKKPIPVEIINPFAPKSTNPFYLSSYQDKLSVLNPISPDRPFKTIPDKAMSLKDFTASLGFEYLTPELTYAFVQDILEEWLAIKLENNINEAFFYNLLSEYAGTLPLPYTVAYDLVYRVWTNLNEIKSKDIMLEGYDF